ncbi:MAG: lipoprotein [Pseudomonadota bacterium]
MTRTTRQDLNGMTRRTALLFGAALTLGACGKKGDLYLPDPAPSPPPASAPARPVEPAVLPGSEVTEEEAE